MHKAEGKAVVLIQKDRRIVIELCCANICFSPWSMFCRRTWEEQKAEHAFLKRAVQSEAQAYPLNQGLGSEGSALFGGLGIAVCLHCPLHSGVFLFPTCRLCFYICCHSVTIFCTVGFKVSSATRASRLQLLM